MIDFMKVLLSTCIIGSIACVFVLIYASYRIVKNENTYKQRMRILNAIIAYQRSRTAVGDYNYDVYCSDMEDYDKTDDRLWDWSYERILPPEKFEIIKPYIK